MSLSYGKISLNIPESVFRCFFCHRFGLFDFILWFLPLQFCCGALELFALLGVGAATLLLTYITEVHN